MNTARMQAAIATITERQKALNWLKEYGAKIEAKKDDAVSIDLTLHYAGSCDGAREARKVIEAYARLRLPEAIHDAIQCCQNDIGMAVSAIHEELDAA